MIAVVTGNKNFPMMNSMQSYKMLSTESVQDRGGLTAISN